MQRYYTPSDVVPSLQQLVVDIGATDAKMDGAAGSYRGVRRTNILGVRNDFIMRGALHISTSPTSSLKDKSDGNLNAHGLLPNLAEAYQAAGYNGEICETSKNGPVFIIENSDGHRMLLRDGSDFWIKSSAGAGWGGPDYPNAHLLAVQGLIWYTLIYECDLTAPSHYSPHRYTNNGTGYCRETLLRVRDLFMAGTSTQGLSRCTV